MPIRIEPLTKELSPAVAAFNRRLVEGGMTEFSLPEHPALDWLPYAENARLYQRPFVAVDDLGFVRGGYIFKKQDFSIGGVCQNVGFLRMPLSEGVVDRAYTSLGPKLVMHAWQRSPLLFCLGMGGMNRPLPRLLKSLRWRVEPIPFFFHVVHGARFLMGMPALREGAARSAASAAAAFTGLGHVALQALQFARPRTSMRVHEVSSVPRFGPEIGSVWSRSRAEYRFAAVRDPETVQTLYDAPGALFHRMEVRHRGVLTGWAAMLDTQMRNSNHFGNLRIGTVVDCDAIPEHAAQVAVAARNFLRARGVDLIVTNQSHSMWITAFSRAGFLNHPSNYIFGASKQLAEAIGPGAVFHMTRGDGDGPIHL